MLRNMLIGTLVVLTGVGCGNRDSETTQGAASPFHADVHRGLEALAAGRIDEGLRQLAEATPGAITASNVPDWHARAVAELIEHERYQQADSLLALCGPVSRRPPEQRYQSAQLTMLRGEPDRALEIYNTVHGAPALMAKVHFERAMIYSMRGDHPKAAEASRSVLGLHAHDTTARSMLVASLIAMDRPVVALEEAKQLPQDRSRSTLEAHAFMALGDADSASVRLDRLLGETSDATLQYLKGWALVEQRRPEEALAWLADLAQMGYKDAELHAARAMDQLGRTDDAATVRTRFLDRQRRQRADALWSQGLSAIQESGPETAYRYLEEAIALDPTNPSLLNDAGAVLTMLRRFDEAEAQFQEALTLRPDDPSTYGNLAQLYELSGNQEKREEALRSMAEAMANQ